LLIPCRELGGIALVYQALRTSLDQLEGERLDDYLARFGSSAVYKRLGYMIDEDRAGAVQVDG
jgi:predicted transcriptional regulator of viral defense system